jgi:hypothetical protein
MIMRYVNTSASILLLLAVLAASAIAQPPESRSTPIANLLRQPLPAENLLLHEGTAEFIIQGPTFAYTVDRRSGMISAIDVRRDGEQMLSAPAPVSLRIDGYKLTGDGVAATTTLVSADAGKVVLRTVGQMNGTPSLPFTLESTFFSDGVVVARVTITPTADLAVTDRIEYVAELSGRLDCYFHKCHERWDSDSGGSLLPLPDVGKQADMTTTTSCLQVMSHHAAAAIFTDLGAYHVDPAGTATASIETRSSETPKDAHVVLAQRIARVEESGAPLLLPADKPFSFRLGLCVAPQRHAHPRKSALRHFTWIGDDRFPYPTNEEIEQVAQLGFNVFQIHRLGLLGQPRPPRGELERVIAKVHEHGMLFILLTLPDILDAHSPRLQQMRAAGEWYLWEANNYGGRYTATMDSYVDYYGTCVGAPNGLADYHLETAAQMLDRFDVDGIYLDDNITQGPNCPHWEAHGHPRPGYDCLIEMHEVNWRRRRYLLERVPHLLLVDHSNIGLWLPLLSPFDAHLYGEGHRIATLRDYWNFYGIVKSMNAQGNLWPGGLDGARFATPGAYVLDLLTGGGQYMYIDWRLFTTKFPYAAGVLANEKELVKAFNLAQHYFGLHDSIPYMFDEAKQILGSDSPSMAVAAYRHKTWGDLLLAVGNIESTAGAGSIVLHQPRQLGIDAQGKYGTFDVLERTYRESKSSDLADGLKNLALPANGLRLIYVRPVASGRSQHVWGGQRIEETWGPAKHRLAIRLAGPTGLVDSIFLTHGSSPIAAVTVNGKPADFSLNSDKSLIWGDVMFTKEPILVEIEFGKNASEWPIKDPPRQSLYPENE